MAFMFQLVKDLIDVFFMSCIEQGVINIDKTDYLG